MVPGLNHRCNLFVSSLFHLCIFVLLCGCDLEWFRRAFACKYLCSVQLHDAGGRAAMINDAGKGAYFSIFIRTLRTQSQFTYHSTESEMWCSIFRLLNPVHSKAA